MAEKPQPHPDDEPRPGTEAKSMGEALDEIGFVPLDPPRRIIVREGLCSGATHPLEKDGPEAAPRRMRRHRMNLRVIQFLAIVFTSLALVPSGTHLFELPNKIDLPRDAYLTAQGIYAGWAWFGIVDLAALIINVVLAIKLARQRPAVYFAWTATLCFVVFFVIFFTWTFPANQTTANWTALPDEWSPLRVAWEYSHAANAVVMLFALCSVTLSVITARPD